MGTYGNECSPAWEQMEINIFQSNNMGTNVPQYGNLGTHGNMHALVCEHKEDAFPNMGTHVPMLGQHFPFGNTLGTQVFNVFPNAT